MGPGQNFLTRVGLDQFFAALVGSSIFDSGLGWNISTKSPKFSNFSLRIKKNHFGSVQKAPASKTGGPLIYCRSKVWSEPIANLGTIILLTEVQRFLLVIRRSKDLRIRGQTLS